MRFRTLRLVGRDGRSEHTVKYTVEDTGKDHHPVIDRCGLQDRSDDDTPCSPSTSAHLLAINGAGRTRRLSFFDLASLQHTS